MVLTMTDSFMTGGHFFNRSTIYRTMCGIILEHYWGPFITNAGHLTSGSILFRLTSSYRRMVEQKATDSGKFVHT